MHRHSDVSCGGLSDGSFIDMCRYGLDAASLDCIAAADHAGFGLADRGNQGYLRRRDEPLCDAPFMPKRFVPFYAYELGMRGLFGHRNVIHPDLKPVLSFLTPQRQIAPDDTRRLDAIAIVHTSATSTGTDWRDYEPTIEPSIEVYQACRLIMSGRACHAPPRTPANSIQATSITRWQKPIGSPSRIPPPTSVRACQMLACT